MREPPPRAASASSSASTSSRARRTTSRRSFRFPEKQPRFSSRPQLPAQLLQILFVADDEQRLRRHLQQIEERAVRGAGVDVAAVGQQIDGSATAGRVEQTLAELLLEDAQDPVQLLDRESAAPQVGEDEQLEQFD